MHNWQPCLLPMSTWILLEIEQPLNFTAPQTATISKLTTVVLLVKRGDLDIVFAAPSWNCLRPLCFQTIRSPFGALFWILSYASSACSETSLSIKPRAFEFRSWCRSSTTNGTCPSFSQLEAKLCSTKTRSHANQYKSIMLKFVPNFSK